MDPILPVWIAISDHPSITSAKRWVGGWGQKMAIFAELQVLFMLTWVGGPKKAKNMLT
jgi:hypothetical protein